MKKSMYTSINSDKLPRAHKILDNRTVRALTGGIQVGFSTIIDHGCGRYIEHVQKHAEDLGYIYIGYDKYWSEEIKNVKTYKEAQQALISLGASAKPLHISSNVMNVITDDAELEEYCIGIYDMMCRQEYLILTVYEAEKPSETQRAEPLNLYVEKLESYYGFITKRQTKGYAVLLKP